MEPFDYLTYKKNKTEEEATQRTYTKEEKRLAIAIWIGTFAFMFVFVFCLVASRTSKIDIEYGRMGNKDRQVSYEVQDEETGENVTKKNKFTIDKRLFLIQQEEKGPSESKTLAKTPEQAEVISNKKFDEIKTNNKEILNKQEETKETVNKSEAQAQAVSVQNKVAIKPKLPLPSENETSNLGVKAIGAIDTPKLTSKVFVGKYISIEDARKVQAELSDTPTFLKKINNHYTLQVGSFDSFDTAKSTAAKLKMRGFDAWIYQ